MKKNIFLKVIVGTVFLYSTFSLAQDYSDPVADGEIIIEKTTDLTQSYRDRRNRYGILFAVNYEKFAPNEYVSLIQNKTFDQMSGGDSIPVISAELGVKMNMSLGSLSGIISYGGGSYTNEKNKIEKISVKMTKASLNFALDNLMNEPWVVPYGQIGMNEIDWSESSIDSGGIAKEETFTTDWNLTYKVGLMFQLDWLESSIDTNTHTNGLKSSGLQNTFLDVFYTSYAEPSEIAATQGATGEASLKSDNFGLGLKLEF